MDGGDGGSHAKELHAAGLCYCMFSIIEKRAIGESCCKAKSLE